MNGVSNFKLLQGTLDSLPLEKWQVVLANILAPVIIALLEEDDLLAYVADGGHLILSGIIDEQADDVKTAVMVAGGQVLEMLTVRDWVTLVVSPK
jgi:ribosomal protein L11 methyltransferase